MLRVVKLCLPLLPEDISGLCVGDKVLLSGTVFTARDAAHQRLHKMLLEEKECPIELSTCAIFYCGPTPTPPGRICGAIGPTTSARMDKYTPMLIEHGLRVMIGKGERSTEVRECIHNHGAVYLSCLGGVSALLSQTIVSCETFLWDDLGAEAIYKLIVKELPCYVTIL